MNKSKPTLPSSRAMLALEQVALLGSITRAAEQLHTSQAAISRHIHQLECSLGVALITRSGRGIELTAIGQRYAQDVIDALTILRQASDRVSSQPNTLTIACTHEVSHLLLMPHYRTLKQALGKRAHLRITTCEYKAIPTVVDAGADIIFEYRKTQPQRLSAVIASEEIVPAVSPAFLVENQDQLDQCPSHWNGIPRLSLSKDNSGWASWDDWFTSSVGAMPDAPDQWFDNYVYALEAATQGEGMVLAWRGFSDRYFTTGQLVPVRQQWTRSGSTLYATATQNGCLKPLSKQCMRLLSEICKPLI